MKKNYLTAIVNILKDGYFSLVINGHYFRKRKDPRLLLHQVEKKASRLLSVPAVCGLKIRVGVREGTTIANGGVYDNLPESLYVMSCFLEDYLSRDVKRKYYKMFFHKNPKEYVKT